VDFKRTQIAEIAEVDALRLQFYIAQGVYDDLVKQGRGKATLLSTRHLIETFLIKELDRKGVILSAIKASLHQLRQYKHFQGYFIGDRIKKLFLAKKYPKIYIIFFNEVNKVDLFQVGFAKGEATRVPSFDMRGYKSAVVIDLTEAFLTVAKL